MCDKSVESYPHALEFVPECYKNKKKGDKAVDAYPSTTEYIPDRFNTQ